MQYVVVIETGAPIELVEASCRWLPGKVVAGPRALHGAGGGGAAARLLLQPPWLPDWVVDELPARSRGGVPLLLALKLFRHGTPVVDPETGARRAYWCGKLPRLTGASKRALDAAVAELVSLGALRVHEPPRAGAARGYSAGYEPPAWGVVPGPGGPGRGVVPALEGGAETATPQIQEGAETATPSDSRAHVYGGGGDPDPLPDQGGMEIHHHPSGESREQILRALRELGVDSPGALLASHGPVRVLGALGELAAERRRGGVRNPAGWLVAALVDRERVFEQAGLGVLEMVVLPPDLKRRWGLDAAFPEWRERAAALGGEGLGVRAVAPAGVLAPQMGETSTDRRSCRSRPPSPER